VLQLCGVLLLHPVAPGLQLPPHWPVVLTQTLVHAVTFDHWPTELHVSVCVASAHAVAPSAQPPVQPMPLTHVWLVQIVGVSQAPY
jgi:hypothetical protein